MLERNYFKKSECIIYLCFKFFEEKCISIQEVYEIMELDSMQKLYKMISSIRNVLYEFHLGYEIICLKKERKYSLIKINDLK